MPALPPLIHDKSRMRRRACTDLCGGRSAMVVPTATVIQKWLWEMAEKRLSWKAHGLLLRPLRRMANPCFYVVSDQKKRSQPFLGEDPGRWAQTTYVQRS